MTQPDALVEFDVNDPHAFASWEIAEDYFPNPGRWRRMASLLLPRSRAMTFEAAYYAAQRPNLGKESPIKGVSLAVVKLVKDFSLKPGDEVLDLGCANGFILREIRRLGMRTTGLEVSEYAIASAPPEIRAHIHIWRGQSLPYSAREFDFVLCKDTLPHMDNPALMIEQIERVGKKALLVIQVADRAWQAKLMKAWDPTLKWCESQDFWENILDAKEFSGKVTFKRLF